MKMKPVKPVELKAFSIGLGVVVGFLAMSFYVPRTGHGIVKNRDPVPKNIHVPQNELQYTEIHGMN